MIVKLFPLTTLFRSDDVITENFTRSAGIAICVHHVFIGDVIIISHNAAMLRLQLMFAEPAIFCISHSVFQQVFIYRNINRMTVSKIEGKKTFLIKKIAETSYTRVLRV